MIQTSFVQWRQLRENAGDNTPAVPAGFDPFTTLHQKAGEIAYFGVHDLSKFYRSNGQLPDLAMDQIGPKAGEIVNADPVEQTITVATQQAPYHYGYHKIEGEKARQNRKVHDDGRMLVTIPVNGLQDISHMVNGANQRIWLVVDGSTKYQQGLMKEIRRKEIERAHAAAGGQQMPQQPQMQPEDPEGPVQGGYADMSMGGPELPPPQQGGYADMSMGGPQGQQPLAEPEQVPLMQRAMQKYRMQGRNVIPHRGGDHDGQMQVAHYDPSMNEHDRYWKRYTDARRYDYVKG